MENKPDGVYSLFFIGCKSLDTVRRGRTPGDLLLPLAVGTAHPPGRRVSFALQATDPRNVNIS